ncbi:MAG TPA: flavodoxin-dependent (E)-4-hydroxy-3-methylbut-2-enyl-diphosphate synthase [bacterium]|nr:flavodoxin-dependent (E)-4-hydroxy-3-methylbut-2-enyl-diphosphate synthase [bacterium]
MQPNNQDRGTRVVSLGGVMIGGGNPVVVQSMTNTDTRDVKKTLRQVRGLAEAGCEVIRLAVPDQESARALQKIIARSPIPVVADIHFDPKLALESLDSGVHGLRLNPGNIRSRKALREIVRVAESRGVPIRVGVNSGSIARDVREKHGSAVEALVASAMEHISLLEEMGFAAIKVSLKASDVMTTIAAYRRMRAMRDYPLHIGITEAGTLFSGLIKSAAGLGVLLAEGIGDTIRISLAADPQDEVRACYSLLRSLKLRNRGVEIVACPTCARAGLDVFKTAAALERRLASVSSPLRIAVMGCGVNGPGEARHSDLGAVGTPKGIQVYVKGARAGTVEARDLTAWMLKKAHELAGEKEK